MVKMRSHPAKAAVSAARMTLRIWAPSGRLAQVGEWRVPEVVGAAVLVQEPEALVGVRHQVGGELQRDQAVDALADAFGDLHQAGGEHVLRHAGGRIPFERDGDDLGLVAGFAEGGEKVGGKGFGAAVDEGDLDRGDSYAHMAGVRTGAALTPALSQ